MDEEGYIFTGWEGELGTLLIRHGEEGRQTKQTSHKAIPMCYNHQQRRSLILTHSG